MIELLIRISNSETSYTHKVLLHEEGLVLSKSDPTLKSLVDQALAEFHGEVEDVVVKIKFIW